MEQREIFDSLVRNAFDFLERGIEEFDRSPKYSVIHFCAAVEMLLKARLMMEHWSLIVSRPDQANLAKFMAGDFISVTLEDARARIRDVADEDIGDDAYASFRALANHRNKMVHFFHSGLESDEKAKAQIVAEHCRSWFHLHRLLSRWSGFFHDFDSEIAHADRSMKGHRKYLATKFKALKTELEAKCASGNPPRTCSACGFAASVPDPFDDQIAWLRCLVCDHFETQVELDCPHCGEHVVLANGGYANCVHCDGAIEPDDLAEALDDGYAAHLAIIDGDDSYLPANCANCDGYHTAIRRSEKYFCTDCFEVSDGAEQCGWCGEPNTGDMEHSYITGCNQCEGRAGREKDD